MGILALVGCATPKSPRLEQVLTTYSREKLEDMDEIKLPMNYSVNNFRKLRLGVAFECLPGLDKKTGEALSIDTNLSTRLQTEMAKLKRFTVISDHNNVAEQLAHELADIDPSHQIVEPSEVRKDLYLSVKVVVTREKIDRYADSILIYEVECDLNCQDAKTRTVKFAEKAKGRSVRRQFYAVTDDVRVGGYSDEDQRQAITQAAMRALAVIANKLGNTFPVGGQIVGVSATGDRMQLNKGFEDGIGNDQQCVIFVNDGGVDVPLALAEAAPGDDKSTLAVYKWNKSDADAKPLIREYQDNPKQFLKKNKIYAVGYGLSTPPEWEQTEGERK